MDKVALQTDWICVPGWASRKKEPHIVCLRRSFEADSVPQKYEIRISAESRYKLYWSFID